MRLLSAFMKYRLRYSSNGRLSDRFSREIIHSPATGSCGTIGFVAENKLMKRTRATVRIQQGNKTEEDDNEEDMVTKSQASVSERPKLNLKSLRKQNTENVCDTTDPQIIASSKRSKDSQKEPKMETHMESRKEVEELKPNVSPSKGKLRGVVDLQMMKAELSQLEDPPATPWEKELSSGRLQYEFFDIPCEELAQRLLGKVLVRYLENGTVLKGRIVETEGYLGAIDKASHSYQNKVTPRNLPMYMPPGTIYVYMTYGMYHCFNISSQGNAHVLIKAVEPLVGLEYMELLRNMRRKDSGREKQIARRAMRLKQYELCNNPFKICDAFVIDQDIFDRKLAYACNNLWLESQPFVRSPTIVAVPSETPKSDDRAVKTRYYVLGSASVDEKNSECEKHAYIAISDGCAVLLRAIDPLEGVECMAAQRNASKTKKTGLKPHELCNGPSKPKKTDLKPHELCNGPSKLCIAYQLNKQHSKYSLCTWKSLWIEDDDGLEDIKIVKSARIGIDSCGPEWASKPLRYYIYGNKSVSKRNKKAEMEIS